MSDGAIPRPVFFGLIHRYPDFAVELLSVYSAVIRRCYERIQELYSLDAKGRICLGLLRLAKQNPVDNRFWHIYPKRTQAEIASFSGTTRETVSRTLANLENAGVLERRRRSIEIRDRSRLEELSVGQV